jgi:hypothetical protein
MTATATATATTSSDGIDRATPGTGTIATGATPAVNGRKRGRGGVGATVSNCSTRDTNGADGETSCGGDYDVGGDGRVGGGAGTGTTTTTTSCGGGSALYKSRRTRTQDASGDSIARRLIDFRGFDLSETQARDIARFIDLLPPEMEPLVRETLDNCVDIDDAIAKLASVKMVEQTAQCSVGDFSEPAVSEANSAGGTVAGDQYGASKARSEREATSSAPVLTVEWVNAIVNEMGASVDMADAQNRASRVLQTFEGAVRQRCAEFSDYSKIMKMKRENALLKRAVAIQNSRMQDLAPLQARVRELEATVAQYDEQLQAVQRQNYSLSVNLRLAMDQSPLGGPSRNHDVF